MTLYNNKWAYEKYDELVADKELFAFGRTNDDMLKVCAVCEMIGEEITEFLRKWFDNVQDEDYNFDVEDKKHFPACTNDWYKIMEVHSLHDPYNCKGYDPDDVEQVNELCTQRIIDHKDRIEEYVYNTYHSLQKRCDDKLEANKRLWAYASKCSYAEM